MAVATLFDASLRLTTIIKNLPFAGEMPNNLRFRPMCPTVEHPLPLSPFPPPTCPPVTPKTPRQSPRHVLPVATLSPLPSAPLHVIEPNAGQSNPDAATPTETNRLARTNPGIPTRFISTKPARHLVSNPFTPWFNGMHATLSILSLIAAKFLACSWFPERALGNASGSDARKCFAIRRVIASISWPP